MIEILLVLIALLLLVSLVRLSVIRNRDESSRRILRTRGSDQGAQG